MAPCKGQESWLKTRIRLETQVPEHNNMPFVTPGLRPHLDCHFGRCHAPPPPPFYKGLLQEEGIECMMSIFPESSVWPLSSCEPPDKLQTSLAPSGPKSPRMSPGASGHSTPKVWKRQSLKSLGIALSRHFADFLGYQGQRPCNTFTDFFGVLGLETTTVAV